MVPLTTITNNKLVTNKKTVKTIKHSMWYKWYKKLKQNHFYYNSKITSCRRIQ